MNGRRVSRIAGAGLWANGRRASWLAAVALAVVGAAVGPAATATATAKSYGKGDTGIVQVSHEPGVSQGEEPLSVNPLNPLQLTTVANAFQPNFPGPLNPFVGGGGIQDSRVYSSQDGGRHWITQKLDQGGIGKLALVPHGASPEFSDAFNILNTDSDSVWDRHGNAYFESGDVHGLYHNGDEVETVWRSTDGGVHWGPHKGYTAVNATKDEHTELDRPWLAIDNSGKHHAPQTHDGRLYTTFETTPFANIPPQVYLKHSDDHAATWTKSVRVDDGVYETQWNPRARPVVGPEGAVNVVYDRAPPTATPFASYTGPIQLVLARSTDGGQTFRRTVIDRDVRRVVSPDEATPAYTEMISAIAVNQGKPGRVAVAWPQAKGPNNSRILLRYATDGGAHWSKRLDTGDDPVRKNNQHDHVTLAWMPDGRLFVGWRDRRCCGGAFDARYQQWVRVFNPACKGGFVPGKRVEYSSGPQPTTESGRGQLQPDEFQGLVATRRGVGLTWSQLGKDDLDHLTFRNVPLSAFGHEPKCERHKTHKKKNKNKKKNRKPGQGEEQGQ